mgnify:FL=1|tara:strand:+ start:861 stop:1055 length:195 start_codon:yes stop_codon:yes gene_type:complete
MNSYEIMGNCSVCERAVKRDSAYDTIEFNGNAVYVCCVCAASYSQNELHEKFMPPMNEIEEKFK